MISNIMNRWSNGVLDEEEWWANHLSSSIEQDNNLRARASGEAKFQFEIHKQKD